MTKLFKISTLVLLIAAASGLVGCSGARIERTKFTDKNFRIMLDPASLDANNHARLTQALVAKDRWVVIDRANGFSAIMREQEMLHRSNTDRFENREKYAMWGKLWGVGAVVTAHVQCRREPSFWNNTKYKNVCVQFLALVDTNTGEILSSASADADSEPTMDYYTSMAPDWKDAVDELSKNYPTHFENKANHPVLENYKDIAGEEARRQQEELARRRLPPQAQVAPAPRPASVAPAQPAPVIEATSVQESISSIESEDIVTFPQEVKSVTNAQ